MSLFLVFSADDGLVVPYFGVSGLLITLGVPTLCAFCGAHVFVAFDLLMSAVAFAVSAPVKLVFLAVCVPCTRFRAHRRHR